MNMTDHDLRVRHVQLHDHEIAYRIAGDGPVVLLIHGMAGSSRSWLDVMSILVRDHTVLAPDLLGHGESAKPLGDYSLGAQASGLRDLLVGVLGIERATVVGQSLGGGVAMQFAYQYPELCERLVLAGSGGLGREVTWVLRLLSLPGAELLLPLVCRRGAVDFGNELGGFFVDRGLRAPPIAEMWRAYSSLADPETRRAFLRTVRAVIDSGGQSVSANDRLYLTSAVPTLILWGARDDIIPVEHAHATAERIAGSRLEIFEKAGHFLHVEQPARFAAVLAEFIEETTPAPYSQEVFQELLESRAQGECSRRI